MAPLLTMLGPQLTTEQATLIFQQGQEAVVFALLNLAKQLAENTLSCPPVLILQHLRDRRHPMLNRPPKVELKRKGRR